jgi:membrane-bound lytic murein transglycosylase B
LALLGAGALAAAAFAASGGGEPARGGESGAAEQTQATSAAPARSAASATSAASAQTDAAAPTPTVAAGDVPIADLPDAAWVSRVAADGAIPERALAAYAGAALEVARTNPSCGVGWNTLAAIGFVETEHASMNGATLRPDGAVTPAIIGIPLDGDGAAAVPDTDGGVIDGDAEWDRAVGPMQFTPSTWQTAAQDGNRDGAKDVNQIDDAALATAMHLCQVGGDLTKADNWIAAISAYNPSVEYNNRVAEAASHYATLP